MGDGCSVVMPTTATANYFLSDPATVAPVEPVRQRSAHRCLFGSPDPESVDKWLTRELDKIRNEQQLKWGYRFNLQKPCDPNTSDWEWTAVPADSVPEFYRAVYYSTDKSRTVPYDTENCMPGSSSNCDSNVNSATVVDETIVTSPSECSDPEVPVLPETTAAAAAVTTAATQPKCSSGPRRRRSAKKKQTKIPAFMNVDSRKRLRQQQQAKGSSKTAESDFTDGSAESPSPSKSIRLDGQCRSSV